MPPTQPSPPQSLSPSGQTRLLLASDHPLLLAGLRTLLAAEAGLATVGEAANGEEIQTLAQTLQPDLLLLDLEMSGSPPTATIAYVHQHCPAVKIIVVTNGDNDTIIRKLVAAGVAGYLLKTEPAELVRQAIRAVAQGGLWFSPPLLEKLIQKPLAWLPPVEAETVNLSEAEVVVLRLVAAGQTDCQIGRDLNLSERTVRNRLQSICQKLGVNTRIEAAVRGVRLGLI